MALPKALLCSLGDYPADIEEAKLREAGFATALIGWKELAAQPQDWMQLSEVLQDDSILAWAIAGEIKDFTREIMAKLSLLTLSLNRERLPETALILCEEGVLPDLPAVLSHAMVRHSLDPFAAKLRAARFQDQEIAELPFHLKTHLDPLLGLWLEVGPEQRQDDFMAGLLEAKVTAFGIGPRGTLPDKCTLSYPLLGIEGDLGGDRFSACASKDPLDGSSACYCKVNENIPTGVFLGAYPQENSMLDVSVITLI